MSSVVVVVSKSSSVVVCPNVKSGNIKAFPVIFRLETSADLFPSVYPRPVN